MKPSIQKKIVLIYLCTIIIIMLVSGTYIVYGTEEEHYINIQRTIENIAEQVENSGNRDLNKTTTSNIENYETYILSPEGIIESSNNRRATIGSKQDAAVVIEARNTKRVPHHLLNIFPVLKAVEMGI